MEGRTATQIFNNIPNENGRFPANVLVSDDALNDGKITLSFHFTRFSASLKRR
jgi:hypothetical protein